MQNNDAIAILARLIKVVLRARWLGGKFWQTRPQLSKDFFGCGSPLIWWDVKRKRLHQLRHCKKRRLDQRNVKTIKTLQWSMWIFRFCKLPAKYNKMQRTLAWKGRRKHCSASKGLTMDPLSEARCCVRNVSQPYDVQRPNGTQDAPPNRFVRTEWEPIC